MSERDEDEDAKAIHARRALFVASALAGLTLTEGCSQPQPPPPQPVTHETQAPPRDAGHPTLDAGEPIPMPCLSPMPCLTVLEPPPVDAGQPDVSVTPTPCLSVIPAPCLSARPRPCLSRAPRRDAGPYLELKGESDEDEA